jgi:hypothetical protein
LPFSRSANPVTRAASHSESLNLRLGNARDPLATGAGGLPLRSVQRWEPMRHAATIFQLLDRFCRSEWRARIRGV